MFADTSLQTTPASAVLAYGQSCGGDVAAVPEWRLHCTVPTEASRTDALQAAKALELAALEVKTLGPAAIFQARRFAGEGLARLQSLHVYQDRRCNLYTRGRNHSHAGNPPTLGRGTACWMVVCVCVCVRLSCRQLGERESAGSSQHSKSKRSPQLLHHLHSPLRAPLSHCA